ncbi:MAG: tetratricopeptide repeat protein [Spirochaetota bacterium]
MIPKRSAFGIPAVLVVLLLVSCATGMTREQLAAEYFNIGNGFLELERPDEASEYFVRALDLDPSLRAAEFNLARAYADAGRYTDAREVLELLLDVDPENTLVLRSYGFVMYRLGYPEEAVESFEAVIDANPADADSWFNLSLLARERGDMDEAYRTIRRARDLEPSADDILVEYALIAHDRDDPEARDLLDEAYEVAPEDTRVLSAFSERSFETGEFAQARDLSDELVSREPEVGAHHFLQARISFVGIEDSERAVVSLRQALERDFRDEAAIATLLDELETDDRELVEALLADYGLGGDE